MHCWRVAGHSSKLTCQMCPTSSLLALASAWTPAWACLRCLVTAAPASLHPTQQSTAARVHSWWPSAAPASLQRCGCCAAQMAVLQAHGSTCWVCWLSWQTTAGPGRQRGRGAAGRLLAVHMGPAMGCCWPECGSWCSSWRAEWLAAIGYWCKGGRRCNCNGCRPCMEVLQWHICVCS